MKKVLITLGVLLSMTSCEERGNKPEPQEKIVTGLLSEDTYWYSDTVYEMAGKVVVDNGVKLTIEAGTIIKSRDGQGSLSTALIVSRGGMIDAQGTANDPIIFTSIYDNGSNLDESDKGLWGGVVILGNAPISADANEALIEGLPANETYGVYGGQNPHDNSGILKFVSIRHAGTLLGDGNELNGLTLGGVGDGTTISDIEVVANLDDGIEWFGGTVDCQNLIVWAQGDDAFDIDQSYDGTISNFLAICDLDSDHALEIDGGEGNMNHPFRMEYGTVYGPSTVEFHFRDGATGYVSVHGDYNVSADSATSVTVEDLMVGVNEMLFDWTFSYENGAF